MAGNKTVSAKIRFNIEAAQANKEVGAVAQSIAKLKAQTESFAKFGGLNSIGISQDKIRLANAEFAKMALELGDVELELHAIKKALMEATEVEQVDKLNRKLITLQATSAGLQAKLGEIPRGLRDSAAASIGYLGDIETALSTLSGSIATIGGSVQGVLGTAGLNVQAGPGADIAQGVNLAAQGFASAEAAIRLNQSLGVMRDQLSKVNLATLQANSALLANVGAFAAVAVAAYGVVKAYDYATKKANEPVKAWIDSLEDVDTTKLDLAAITTRRQLETLRSQQTEYKAILEEQIGNTRYLLENSKQALADQTGALGAAIDIGQTFDLAPVTGPIKAFQSELNSLEGQLSIVNSNLSMLNIGLAEISITAAEAAAAAQNDYDLTLRLLRLQRTGTRQQLADELQAAQIEQEATTKTLVDLQNEYTQALRDQVATFSSGAGIDEYLAQFTGDALIAELEKMLTTAGQTLTPGTQMLLDTIGKFEAKATELDATVTALSDGSLAAVIDARERETELLEAQKRLMDEITSAQTDYQKSLGEIADAQSDLREQQEQDARDRQVAVLEAKIEAAKQREATSAHQQALSKIRADGQKSEKAIVDKGIKAERDSRAKLLNSISQINREFMDAQLKEWESYRTEEQRALEDSSRARLRIIQDTENALKDAARKNDVSAFISAQQGGLTDLARLDEDSSVESRRRREDFDRERREAIANRDQRLADLRAQYQDERKQRQAEAQQQLTDLQAQTEQRLAQQRDAGNRELKESEVLQQQLEQLRASFAEETKRRERNERTRDANQRLADAQAANRASLNQLRLYNEQRARIEIAGTNQILNSITRLFQGRGGSTSITSTSTGQSSSVNVPLLGNINVGTPNTQNTRGSRSGGNGGGSGTTNTIYVNAQVGELVTPSEVNLVVDNLKKAIIDGLNG